MMHEERQRGGTRHGAAVGDRPRAHHARAALFVLVSGVGCLAHACGTPAAPESTVSAPLAAVETTPASTAPSAPGPIEAAPSEPSAAPPPSAVPSALPPPSVGDVDLIHAVPAAVAVSSVYRGETEQIARLVDGDPATAWNSRTGELTAAWIEVRVPSDATVTGIALTAGFAREGGATDLFTENLRVRAVRVLRDGAEIGRFDLDPESRALQTLAVTGPGGVYRIEIAELVPGARSDWQEVCVSELRVLGTSPSARAGAFEPATAVGTLPDPASAIAAPPLAREDAAYLLVPDAILRAGDDGHFRRVHPEASALFASPDGAVYVRRRVEGHDALEAVAGAPRGTLDVPNGPVIRAQFGPSAIWVLGDGLARWDGASWTTWSTRGTFGSDRILDLSVERDGTAHVLTPDAVFAATADGFARGPAPPLRRHYGQSFGRFVRDAPALTVADHLGAFRLESGVWVDVAEPDAVRTVYRSDGSRIALREDGDLVFTPASGEATTIALAERGVHATSLRGGWDGRGRFWGETDLGVVVLDPDLSIARWYAVGSVSGLGSYAPTLVLVGAGPAVLPDAREPDGHVRGTITSGGTPLAGARVDLCADADIDNLHSFDTPCGGAEWLGRATTRADGTFDLWGVPEAIYEVTVRRADGSWYVDRSNPCCSPQRRGHVFDMRPLEVAAQ